MACVCFSLTWNEMQCDEEVTVKRQQNKSHSNFAPCPLFDIEVHYEVCFSLSLLLPIFQSTPLCSLFPLSPPEWTDLLLAIAATSL